MENEHHVTVRPEAREWLEQVSAGGGRRGAPNRPRPRVAMLHFDDLGRDEGKRLGPRPGEGAVVHHSSGEADFDGRPGDELPSRQALQRKLTVDAPAPHERSAD